MKNIIIDFSTGLGKRRRVTVIVLLAVSLVSIITSVLLLAFASVKFGSYLMIRSENQQSLTTVQMDYSELSERVSNYMQSLPDASVSLGQGSCAQPLIHLAEIETQLPRSAAISRFDFSVATGVITVLVTGSSSTVLASFIRGIESSGRYDDVRIKQKTVDRSKQYEVQYRCQS